MMELSIVNWLEDIDAKIVACELPVYTTCWIRTTGELASRGLLPIEIEPRVAGDCRERLLDLLKAIAEEKTRVMAPAFCAKDKVTRFASFNRARWFIHSQYRADASIGAIPNVRDDAFHLPRHRLSIASTRQAKPLVRTVRNDLIENRLRVKLEVTIAACGQ